MNGHFQCYIMKVFSLNINQPFLATTSHIISAPKIYKCIVFSQVFLRNVEIELTDFYSLIISIWRLEVSLDIFSRRQN